MPFDIVLTFDNADANNVGVSPDGGLVIADMSTVTWGDAGVFSDQFIPDGKDGEIHFYQRYNPGSPQRLCFGLSRVNTGDSYADVEYGILTGNTNADIYESGSTPGVLGTAADHTLYTIKAVGSVIEYWREHAFVYESLIARPAGDLYCKVALSDPGGRFQFGLMAWQDMFGTGGGPSIPTSGQIFPLGLGS